ncbi:MAG: DUF192 domain-containing protein [Bacillota bacterium]
MVSVYRGEELLFPQVKLANNFWTRWRGLLYYREMPAIDGLLLYPCNFTHMFGMRFPLDLIYLSRDREILLIMDVLVPNKLGPLVKNAYYVLETEAGMMAVKKIRKGDRLWWK